ncbi:MAG: hypothetical protein J5798_01275 [Spirochaetaceae bacterium]|nr:hypothetical protein [Spirochaetaceae bacterium]
MKKIALVLMLICFGFSLFAEDSNEFSMFPNLNFSIDTDDTNEFRMFPDLDCPVVSDASNELLKSWNKLSDDESGFVHCQNHL